MGMLSGFPTEDVVLYKLSGDVIRGICAVVESKTIYIDDAKISVEEGDFFERTLPNGLKEIYRVIERGFYRGMGNMSDHYQTKVEKTDATAMKMAFENNMPNKRPHKVFISHSSHDKEYVKALVELLEDLGMPDGSIVCTSAPGHGIPGGAKIYDWLRDQFLTCDLRVVFVLSNNYYDSPASLNEMGAAWITKGTDTLMLLPGFDFGSIRGCIDATKVGMKLDGDVEELKHRLNELKDTLIIEHGLSDLMSARWERIRDRFITCVQEICINEKMGENNLQNDEYNRLIMVEEQKQKNEINNYRYSRLYDLILNWHNYDSEKKGETAGEIAFNRLLNLFLDDSGRYDIAKPLLDECYVEPLEIKKAECEKLLGALVAAETPSGKHSKEFPAIKERYFKAGGEFSDLLKNTINRQLEILLKLGN